MWPAGGNVSHQRRETESRAERPRLRHALISVTGALASPPRPLRVHFWMAGPHLTHRHFPKHLKHVPLLSPAPACPRWGSRRLPRRHLRVPNSATAGPGGLHGAYASPGCAGSPSSLGGGDRKSGLVLRQLPQRYREAGGRGDSGRPRGPPAPRPPRAARRARRDRAGSRGRGDSALTSGCRASARRPRAGPGLGSSGGRGTIQDRKSRPGGVAASAPPRRIRPA